MKLSNFLLGLKTKTKAGKRMSKHFIKPRCCKKPTPSYNTSLISGTKAKPIKVYIHLSLKSQPICLICMMVYTPINKKPILETTLENKKPTNSKMIPNIGNAKCHGFVLLSDIVEFKL